MTWSWRDEGFAAAPKHLISRRPLTLYRVWGGESTETGRPHGVGVCLSFTRAGSRRHAEGLFAVFEWGNSCRYLTSFTVWPGASLYVGPVDPGDFFDSGIGIPGTQVFMEQAQFRKFARKRGDAVELDDDLGDHVLMGNPDGRIRPS